MLLHALWTVFPYTIWCSGVLVLCVLVLCVVLSYVAVCSHVLLHVCVVTGSGQLD